MEILSVSIDVTKIDKAKLVVGKKGTYYNFTILVNDEPNQYGKNVSLCQDQSKEQREAKQPREYIGGGKTIFKSQGEKENQPTKERTVERNGIETTDDLPF